MSNINKIFFRGLVTILPIAITIYVVYQAIGILDGILRPILRWILPQTSEIPGLGMIFVLILIYFFGLLLNNFFTRKFFSSIERKITEVPFVKAIYSPLRDLMNLFSKSGQDKLSRVVLVEMGGQNAYAMGLVTRETFEDLNLHGHVAGKIAVYFPLSYGLGGFTFLVSREKVKEIDIPVEKAMSLAITGWVKSNNDENMN